MKKILRKLKYALWVLNGYLGLPVSSGQSKRITVLITYFNPIRMKDINSQIRNILKCSFVDKIVISNHNPDIWIEDKIAVRDSRLVFLNQEVPRACGYRWRVARTLTAEYMILLDDDILLFPFQIKVLFEALIKNPIIPHGLSGLLPAEDGTYHYRVYENVQVRYLCEVYAVARYHVDRYFELERLLAEQDVAIPEAVEQLGDYILISQTADQDPQIHNVGRIFRSDTFKTPGIANHKDGRFEKVLADVSKAVENVRGNPWSKNIGSPAG